MLEMACSVPMTHAACALEQIVSNSRSPSTNAVTTCCLRKFTAKGAKDLMDQSASSLSGSHVGPKAALEPVAYDYGGSRAFAT